MPLAQASALAVTGPCTPRSMATSHAAMFGITDDTKYGLTRPGSRPVSFRVANSISPIPATAQFTTTPVRSASSPARLRPASATASRAAAMASWLKRAERRTLLVSSNAAGSKPLTSPAIRVGRPLGSKAVIVSIPDTPLTRACHVVSRSLPTGVMAPKPVTTTCPFTLSVLLFRPSRGGPKPGRPVPLSQLPLRKHDSSTPG